MFACAINRRLDLQEEMASTRMSHIPQPAARTHAVHTMESRTDSNLQDHDNAIQIVLTQFPQALADIITKHT
jgi:ribosomal 50S subunit-associated protein YjgA (DUF615 family)